MSAYRNARSFTTSRRHGGHANGFNTPIRCCYPYTPASPASTKPILSQDLALVCAQSPAELIHPNPQPLFPNSTPVTRSLPENPTSDLALPSLEHLVKALHAIAPSSGMQHSSSALQDCLPTSRRGGHKHPTPDRHGRMPSCERNSSHRNRDRRMSSRDRRERRSGAALALTPHHPGAGYESDREAEHVLASPAPIRRAFETSSPKVRVGKMHYVPATPAHSTYSPKTASLKATSPMSFKNDLPTPPPSHPSSSPKQYPSSPPKRHYTPAPPAFSSPSLPPRDPAAEAAFFKFKRLVLACRETAEDDKAIEALMNDYDRVMSSLNDNTSDIDSNMD